MHRLFGKPRAAAPPGPSLGDASTNISGKINELDTKIKGLDDEMRRYKEQLKKTPNNATVKKRALDALKRKRMYENQRDQMANQQFNLDQTAFAIETVKNTQVTVAAMKDASKVLKKEQKKINLADLEDMQDDMEDLLEDVGEINEILGRSYGCPEGVDEEDLDAELACLEDEFESEEIETAAPPTTVFSSPMTPGPLPSAPTSTTSYASASSTAAQPAYVSPAVNSLV
mmetsp:Transcript_20480/g.28191  ORF Transcript_20480/g.28191 Transcript_20480/m.28191 type:complete len:229 (+) Transcript_20480:8-694(+)